MSPEQARGQPVDRRTDVWAFGCVLFEMLAGSSAFGRQTVTDTIAAVVGAEPDWTTLPDDTPASIKRMLTRCLQKDARRRLHDIADARIELEDAIAAPPGPASGPAPRKWPRPAVLALSLALAAALVLFLATRDRFGRAAEPPPADTRVTRLTDLPGLEESPAISPDGKVGRIHRRRERQTTALRAAHCQRRAPADHARPGRSRVPPLVARLELDLLLFAGGIRTAPGEHLGDPGAWRRTAARRQQRGRCRRRRDGWTACVFPAGKGGHRAGDRANGRFQVRRGRQARGRHVLPVSPLVAGR